jgi:hypothetical protein
VEFKVDSGLDHGWLENLLDEPTTVDDLNEVMTLNCLPPQLVKSEHSYSLINGSGTSHDVNFALKMEQDETGNIYLDLFCFILPDFYADYSLYYE